MADVFDPGQDGTGPSAEERRSESMDGKTSKTKGGSQRTSSPSSWWAERYGQEHRLKRITEFPCGIEAPKRVRIYHRRAHFVLQWWDPGAKQTLADRVDGDLVAAIARARDIDARLVHFRSSGRPARRVGHEELVGLFLADLVRRADAGEIGPRTVDRYASALREHYLTFAAQPDVHRRFRHASSVDRDFQLQLAAHLKAVSTCPNRHPNSRRRPMKSQQFVLDVARAMFEWAADPDRGGLMPDGFRNPFLCRGQRQAGPVADPLGEPDISLAMAADFLLACDAYQLRLFAPMVFYGLRAAEPCFLFHEDVDGGWLKVACRPELAYQTKGRRDKRLPVIVCIAQLLGPPPGERPTGLLYHRRRVEEGRGKRPLLGALLETIVEVFEQRCAATQVRTAAARQKARDQVLREAGGITYDHIVAEFRKVATRLAWPAQATLKDFRHLFATTLENAGVPEFYRRYLMGQSAGRAAIVTYTHLNELRERYEEAVQRKFQPLVDAVLRRTRALGLPLSAGNRE